MQKKIGAKPRVKKKITVDGRKTSEVHNKDCI